MVVINDASIRSLVDLSMNVSKLDLEKAFSRTEPYRVVTPLVPVPFLNERWNAEVWVKHEAFQPIGAFKIRGASNFITQLSREELDKGVVTHSSGNHAQAVAFMAKQLGSCAYIIMPEDSNPLKIKNARKWGAEVQLCTPGIESRLRSAEKVMHEKGAIMVPPFDHPWIVAGQATAAMETFMLRSDVDYLVTPLGGGGLLAGSALAAKYFSPETKVIGAEPDQAKDGYIGFKKGERERTVQANTVADGLRTPVGEVPFNIIKEEVADIWLAQEEKILPWMFKFWQETHLIIEPSCAVPFAAMDANRDQLKGKRIVVVITGANVDLGQLTSAGDVDATLG